MNRDQCAALIVSGAVVSPNADISGLGVLIAFIFSAGATLLATLVAYCTGLVDEGLLRPVDRLVLRAPTRARRYLNTHVALRKAILALSDQQIVTGIAILGAGFNELKNASISVYHFQIVVYLAWMSSSVHLSALTLLRPFLHCHRGMMWWRLAGMLVLLVMLLVALVPTVSNDWGVVSVYFERKKGVAPAFANNGTSVFGVPARCYWGHSYGDGANPDAVLSFVVLLLSYCWKMLGIFAPVRTRMERWFRNPVDRLLEHTLRAAARRYRRRTGVMPLVGYRCALGLYLPLTAFLEVLGSFSAALWMSILGYIYGVMQILIPRSLVQTMDPRVQENEDKFAFGQLLPLILLVQPLGAILEHVGLLRGTAEEGFYGTADPYSAAVTRARDTGLDDAVSLPDRPLPDFMASYSLPSAKEVAPQRFRLRALLYTSKLFHLLVWMTQAAVLGTAVTVFYADYFTIGYVTTGAWSYVAFGSVAWLGATPLVTITLAGRSILGRYTKRERTGDDTELPACEPTDEADTKASDACPSSEEQRDKETAMDTSFPVRSRGHSVGAYGQAVAAAGPTLSGREDAVWSKELGRRSHDRAKIRESRPSRVGAGEHDDVF